MPVASANLVPARSHVTPGERHARNRHRGAVVWCTGLSGAGKTTLAFALERRLFDLGGHAVVLDGDNVRFGLSANLGFSAEDRAENIRRVAETARLFAEVGAVVATALISPYRGDRERARAIVQRGGSGIPFVEVHLSAPLDVCEARDVKQLYARARAGEIKNFTGVSAPFEAPIHPDLAIDTSVVPLDAAVESLIDYLTPLVVPHD